MQWAEHVRLPDPICPNREFAKLRQRLTPLFCERVVKALCPVLPTIALHERLLNLPG